MRDLRTLREVGEAMNRAELELPCDGTIAQSVETFAMLYLLAQKHLAETSDLFRADREAEVIEMQKRLRQLNRRGELNGTNRNLAQAVGASASAA
jgi:hypothetical protein